MRCGAQVREGRKERNAGEAWRQGIELRERSFAGVFSHSEQTGVSRQWRGWPTPPRCFPTVYPGR